MDLTNFTTTVKRIKLYRNTTTMNPFKLWLHHGDAERSLFDMDFMTNAVQTIITSPPYYPQQRSYGLLKSEEIGQEETAEEFIDNIVAVFRNIRFLLKDNGNIFIVIDDGVKDGEKLNIPFKLIEALKKTGYIYRDTIIWQKMNPPQGKLSNRLYPTYENIIWMSKLRQRPFFEVDRLKMKRRAYDPILTNAIYTYHNFKSHNGESVVSTEENSYVPMIDYDSLLEGVFISRRDYLIRHKINFEDFQIEPINRNSYLICKYERIIKSGKIEEFPSTDDIASAFGFDPDKYCPVCYQKYKRHSVRNTNLVNSSKASKASIFALCNANGRAFTNLWKLSIGGIGKGKTHEAVFPFSLVYRLIKFSTNVDDLILDPFCGRGTTGMMAYVMNRNFTGIDLYKKNIDITRNNIEDLINGKYRIEFYDHELA